MILIRALAFLLHFSIVPIGIGRLITYRANNEIHRNPIVVYMTGLFGSWGIFYVLFAIIEWHQNWNTISDPYLGCFSILVKIYSVVIALLILAVLILDRKNILPAIKTSRQRFNNWKHDLKETPFAYVYIAIFAILLLVQLYFAFRYQINQWSYDDYEYVVTSLDNINSDSINYINMITADMPYTLEKRSSASWTTYISYLAETSGFEVTTISHTILPVILLLIAYTAYYYMSGIMFQEQESRIVFMIILSAAFIFGFYSHYSVTFRLLCALWQGKAILAAIIVPYLFSYLINLYKSQISYVNLVPIATISLGMCSTSFMAAFIIASVQALMWIAVSIRERRIVNVAYLLVGMIGPVVQVIFYGLLYMYVQDMRNFGPGYFKN